MGCVTRDSRGESYGQSYTWMAKLPKARCDGQWLMCAPYCERAVLSPEVFSVFDPSVLFGSKSTYLLDGLFLAIQFQSVSCVRREEKGRRREGGCGGANNNNSV